MIRKAEFTSVWDDGKTKVTTSCEVDLETREIFTIEKKEADVKNLDYQYITIDGKDYPAINLNDTDDFDETNSKIDISAIDYDALACVIMDAYESDRAESGRKEIVKGIKYTLQKYQTAHDREIIDDMLMNFTGYTLETLVEKSIGYDYSQYDELEDFD